MKTCPKCNGVLREIIHEDAIEYKCDTCSYRLIIENNQINNNQQNYDVILTQNNEPSRSTINAIKMITGLNNTEVETIIKTKTPYLLYTGKKEDIKDIEQILNNSSVDYMIQ